MKLIKLNLLILPALLMSAGMSNAAVVAYAGFQLNIDGNSDQPATRGWHTTGTGVSNDNVKPLDIDGNNALGSDGWVLAANGTGGVSNPPRFLPNYITTYNSAAAGTRALAPNANTVSGIGVTIDLPATGALNLNPGNGSAASWHNNSANAGDLFEFTIQNVSSLAGEALRVGLLFDSANTDTTGTQVFRITQTVGGSATANSPSLAHAKNGLDVAFFDLTGLANGDRFVVNVDATSRTHLSGITFDSAVIPEPSAALLGGLGLLALLRRRA